MSSTSTMPPKTLPKPFPPDREFWTCPETGIKIPKIPKANVAWRKTLLEQAAGSENLQRSMRAACRDSLLFFINAFCWTWKKWDIGENGNAIPRDTCLVPWITWEIQDKHLTRIHDALMQGQSLLTDKSRDMGATWNHLGAIYWFLRFHNEKEGLMLSNNVNNVDSKGAKGENAQADPDTLFGKIDLIHNNLPAWLRPRRHRVSMSMRFPELNSYLIGSTANQNAGTSKREDFVFLDEMSKMEHAALIKQSLGAVTNCLLPCSTPSPKGSGTAYSQWRQSGQIPVFVLPWWEHPEKGLGRELIQDETTKDWEVWSPWRRRKIQEITPREWAIEHGMNHMGAGALFFDQSMMNVAKAAHCRPPKSKVMLKWHNRSDSEMSRDQVKNALKRKRYEEVHRHPARQKAKWSIWMKLIDGKPDQTMRYIFGIDISKGEGASNSAVSVVARETRQKVAEYACATIAPYDFAYEVARAALWFGGANSQGLPYLIWEQNGSQGTDFGRVLVNDFGYPYFYNERGQNRGNDPHYYGFHTNNNSKYDLLNHYARNLAHGGFVNPSEIAMDEALSYVTFDNGCPGPADLVEESAEARKAHGDRAMADALACWALEGTKGHPSAKSNVQPSGQTMAGVWKRIEQRRKRRKSGDYYNFKRMKNAI